MKIGKVKTLAPNLHDKTEYGIHIRNLKQALNQRLFLKKLHRFIKSNENSSLKRYTDMNTDLRKKGKNDFEKYFFNLKNNAVLGKLCAMWENIDILNLSQQKLKETLWCQNQIIILPSFSQKICQLLK